MSQVRANSLKKDIPDGDFDTEQALAFVKPEVDQPTRITQTLRCQQLAIE